MTLVSNCLLSRFVQKKARCHFAMFNCHPREMLWNLNKMNVLRDWPSFVSSLELFPPLLTQVRLLGSQYQPLLTRILPSWLFLYSDSSFNALASWSWISPPGKFTWRNLLASLASLLGVLVASPYKCFLVGSLYHIRAVPGCECRGATYPFF